jgi:hypothetical protein
MIKKVVIAVVALVVSLNGFAQRHLPDRPNTYSDEEPAGGFSKQNVFLGGSLSVGYSGYDFNIGSSPEIGWSLNRYLDMGLVVNLNYSSERADPTGYYNPDTRYRAFNYGAGAFGRFYPLPFLFIQAQPEYNWIKYSTTEMFAGGASNTYTQQASSFLLGIGYGQRVIGHANFYIALLFDAESNPGSPYRDPYTNVALPIIRGGFDIYLHQR